MVTKYRKPQKWLNAIASVLAAAVIGAPAVAADDSDEITLEEIVVTATFRDTDLMDTPISISALTEDQLIAKGVNNIWSLYNTIPGLNMNKATSGFNTLTIRGITPYAEGNGSPVGAYLNNMPVGSTSGDSSHFALPTFDLDRIEVLKGPQGTLYGEGAMGGALRYITKKPNPEGFDFAVRASSETMSHSHGWGHRLDAMVNVPLGEIAAVRAILYSRDQKGLLDAPGRGQDTDWEEDSGGRVTLGIYPTDNVQLEVMYMDVEMTGGAPAIGFHCYEELRTDVNLIEIPSYNAYTSTNTWWNPGPERFNCIGDHNTQFTRDPYVTHKAHPDLKGTNLDETLDEYTFTNVDFVWDTEFLGGSTFTATWSNVDRFTKRAGDESPPHVNFSRRFVEDFNCGFSPFFSFLPTGECLTATAPTINPATGEGAIMSGQICHSLCMDWAERDSYELRLVSNNDNKLQFAVGYYFKENEVFGGNPDPCPDSVSYAAFTDAHCGLLWLFNPGIDGARQAAIVDGFLNRFLFPFRRDRAVTEEEAFFGDVSYAINDQWEVTAGIRVADITVVQDTFEREPNPTNTIQDSFTHDQQTTTSPKVGLTWRPSDDLMVYGIWSHGFRPGIVQASSQLADVEPVKDTSAEALALYNLLKDLQTIDGDEVESIELGVKATLADGRFSFTTAYFNMDWTDIIIEIESVSVDLPGVLSPFPFSYANNAGDAETEGLEFEIESRLTDSLTLKAGGAWMWKAEIGTASVGNDARVEGSTALGVVPGNKIPGSPEYSGSISLDYDFEIGPFDATARMEQYFQGRQWRGPDNERPTKRWHRTDLRLTLRHDLFDVALFVNNAGDEVIAYERNQQGYNFGRARTMGMEVNWSL